MRGNIRETLCPAYLLHHRAYRNTSVLLSLFTQSHGRISLVARGVRTARSITRPLLQAFRPLLVSWSLKSELGSMHAVEPNGLSLMLPGNRIISGFYINELVERLLPRQDPSPRLYQVYERTLHALVNQQNQQKTLRMFEKTLLDELGYGLVLDREAENGAPVFPGQQYYYDLDGGPVPLTAVHLTAKRDKGLILRGESLLSFAAGELNDRDSLREIKALTRAALNQQLGNRPLRSREMFVPVSHQPALTRSPSEG